MSGLENYECAQGYYLQHQMITIKTRNGYTRMSICVGIIFIHARLAFLYHCRNYEAFIDEFAGDTRPGRNMSHSTEIQPSHP